MADEAFEDLLATLRWGAELPLTSEQRPELRLLQDWGRADGGELECPAIAERMSVFRRKKSDDRSATRP